MLFWMLLAFPNPFKKRVKTYKQVPTEQKVQVLGSQGVWGSISNNNLLSHSFFKLRTYIRIDVAFLDGRLHFRSVQTFGLSEFSVLGQCLKSHSLPQEVSFLSKLPSPAFLYFFDIPQTHKHPTGLFVANANSNFPVYFTTP